MAYVRGTFVSDKCLPLLTARNANVDISADFRHVTRNIVINLRAYFHRAEAFGNFTRPIRRKFSKRKFPRVRYPFNTHFYVTKGQKKNK